MITSHTLRTVAEIRLNFPGKPSLDSAGNILILRRIAFLEKNQRSEIFPKCKTMFWFSELFLFSFSIFAFNTVLFLWLAFAMHCVSVFVVFYSELFLFFSKYNYQVVINRHLRVQYGNPAENTRWINVSCTFQKELLQYIVSLLFGKCTWIINKKTPLIKIINRDLIIILRLLSENKLWLINVRTLLVDFH